jgi:hypothetical protein
MREISGRVDNALGRGERWRLTALQVEGTEALQVPKLVAVDFAEAVVELVVWEVVVGVRVPDMAARLDM